MLDPYYSRFFFSWQAMVSGAIAGFLDVAYNFNTQALQDDNLIGWQNDSVTSLL